MHEATPRDCGYSVPNNMVAAYRSVTPFWVQTPDNLFAARMLGVLNQMAMRLFHMCDLPMSDVNEWQGMKLWGVEHPRTFGNDAFFYVLKIYDLLRRYV